MTSLPYPVYDADNHYYETADAFLRYLPKQYRNEFQYVEVRGRTKLAVAGQITNYIPNPTFEVVAAPGSHEKWYRAQNPDGLSLRELQGAPITSPESFRSSTERLKLMDEQGLHASVFFPTLASVIEERMNHDHVLMASVVHSLNQWVDEEWGFAREGRIFAAPVISLADVDLAIDELEWALKRGARSICMRPAPISGYRSRRSPGAAEFDPFWARCAEAKIFVNLHLSDSGYDQHYRKWSGGEGQESVGFEKADPLIGMFDPMSRAIFDMISALICHGVADRHPDIRFVSVENGSVWMKELVRMFKKVYGQGPQQFARDPIENLRRNFFVVPFYEDNIQELVEMMGVNRVLFGSDYPHAEGLGDPLSFVDELKGFSDADIKLIMSDNMKGLLEGARN
ncbi:MAG: amidohydrolase [Alphaproteobacteria bacterium]|nr:amidohydrolase [Alphaproteobacteria bacterium]